MIFLEGRTAAREQAAARMDTPVEEPPHLPLAQSANVQEGAVISDFPSVGSTFAQPGWAQADPSPRGPDCSPHLLTHQLLPNSAYYPISQMEKLTLGKVARFAQGQIPIKGSYSSNRGVDLNPNWASTPSPTPGMVSQGHSEWSRVTHPALKEGGSVNRLLQDSFFLNTNFYLFTYLTAPGLSYSVWNLVP